MEPLFLHAAVAHTRHVEHQTTPHLADAMSTRLTRPLAMRDLTISHAALLRRPGSRARAEPGGELNGDHAGLLLQRPGLAQLRRECVDFVIQRLSQVRGRLGTAPLLGGVDLGTAEGRRDPVVGRRDGAARRRAHVHGAFC